MTWDWERLWISFRWYWQIFIMKNLWPTLFQASCVLQRCCFLKNYSADLCIICLIYHFLKLLTLQESYLSLIDQLCKRMPSCKDAVIKMWRICLYLFWQHLSGFGWRWSQHDFGAHSIIHGTYKCISIKAEIKPPDFTVHRFDCLYLMTYLATILI